MSDHHRTKKLWTSPAVRHLSLKEARAKIVAALKLTEGHKDLDNVSSELRLAIEALDHEMAVVAHENQAGA